MAFEKIKNDLKSATYTCDYTNYDMFSLFLKKYEIDKYFKNTKIYCKSISNFFKSGRQLGKTEQDVRAVFDGLIDHCMFYKTKNNKIILTSHIYNLTPEQAKQKFTDNGNNVEFDIEVFDSKESWYNPNETTLVLISLKEKQISNSALELQL